MPKKPKRSAGDARVSGGQRGHSRPLRKLRGFEILEDRRLLSGASGHDPTLTIVTHGFDFWDQGLGIPDWAKKIVAEAKGVQSAWYGDGAQRQQACVEEGPDLWDLGAEPEIKSSTTDLFVLVDWRSGFIDPLSLNPFDGGPAAAPAGKFANSIRRFLDSRPEKWDVLLIGHSRGAIFNTYVASYLLPNTKIDYIESVLLDPTSATIWADPTSLRISDAIDKVINYDDGRTLEVVSPVPVVDGFKIDDDLHGPKLIDNDVGLMVDQYRFGSGAALINAWFEIGSTTTAATAYALGDSIWSHISMGDWYRVSKSLEADVRTFLRNPDSGQKAEPDEQPLGKPPSGIYPTITQPSPPTGVDDHSNSFGSAATSVAWPGAGAIEIPGTINSATDHDWFKFVPRESGPVLIEVVPTSGLVPYIRFHADEKTLLAHNAGSGAGHGAMLVYGNAQANRTYYIGCNSHFSRASELMVKELREVLSGR